MLKGALLLTAGIVIGGVGVGGAVVVANENFIAHAATGPAVYSVFEATVTDQAAYEKALPEVQKIINENHGTRVAGGFNMAKSINGAAPGNRYVILKFDSEADFTKSYESGSKAWIEKNAPGARQIMVESVQ